MIFQAKKRKMGLLEDDEKELSVEEVKGIDFSTGIVNARGKLILRWRLIHCRWMVPIFNVSFFLQITQIELSTRSWLR